MLRSMNRNFIIALCLVAVLRIVMIAGLFCDVPYVSHEGWEFHQGGDQIEYFRVAKSIVELEPEESKYAIGFPLILASFVAASGAGEWTDLLAPVLIFNCILSLIAIFLIGILAKLLTESTLTAIASAILWTLHPFIIYAGLSLHRNAEILQAVHMSHSMWFPILSDPCSAFFFILGLVFFVHSIRNNVWIYPCGILVGIASLIRTPNLVEALIFGTAYLIKKKYLQGIIFGGLVAVFLLPQLAYNIFCNGNPFAFGYTAATEGYEEMFSLDYLISFVKLMTGRYLFIFIPFLIMAIVLPASLLLYRKEKRLEWAILIALIYSYILIYGSWWAFKHFPYRFLIPVIPLVIIMASDFVRLLWERLIIANRICQNTDRE
jgi:hypothetical protein